MEIEENNLPITGSQCRAARALVELSREEISNFAGVDVDTIRNFEQGVSAPDDETNRRIQHAFEESGALFIEENGGGIGVRLKLNRKEVKAINKWEGEGGTVGEDDV